MFLIFGLGNPGEKYQFTRHNVGARIIEHLESLNLADTVLAVPATFMNESGKEAKSLLRRHVLKINNLIVIHDDLDIPLGEIRVVKNRGSAGHKGVDSIIKEIGTKDFVRFRIGVCPKSGKPQNPEKFVLQKFNKEEREIIKQIIEKATEAIEFFLKEGLEKTMGRFNK